MVIKTLALACLAAMLPVAAHAQQLSLADAIERADARAFGNRIADARALEQRAQQWKPLAGILPTIRIDAGLLRTTDPVAAFGTTLRQRRIEQADFDPTRLNYPGVSENYVGALVIEQPLLNLDAHLGRVAASRMSDAADGTRAWSRSATRLDVMKAYFGAVLAREKIETLTAAVTAARAHVDHAEKLVQQGLATKSDALLARVKAGELEAELLSARGDATLAQRQLALLLGEARDTTLLVPAQLPSYANVRSLLEAQQSIAPALAQRNDVISAERMAAAARSDVRRAYAITLPRLNAFARYDWNSQSGTFQGDENWTVGVMASWTPFAGAADWGERKAAGARADAAAAGLEAARAQAALEAESADIQRDVALARLDIAKRGAEQSTEAHRIVTRKYEGGLGTVVELLDAAAAETQSSLALSHARYTGVVAAATRLRAIGRDPIEIIDSLERELAGAYK